MPRFMWTGLLVVILMSCQPEGEVPADIGLQFYSLRNQFEKNIPGTLQLIKDWGIQSIEGGETYGMELDVFMHLLAENDLKVHSIGADYKDLATSPEMVIGKAKLYGAKYVMCPWIPHEGDEFTLENTREAISVFNKA
ncbi:MAG: hypothetical protein ABF295_13265, partial [Flavobacteriaceae bacterium]